MYTYVTGNLKVAHGMPPMVPDSKGRGSSTAQQLLVTTGHEYSEPWLQCSPPPIVHLYAGVLAIVNVVEKAHPSPAATSALLRGLLVGSLVIISSTAPSSISMRATTTLVMLVAFRLMPCLSGAAGALVLAGSYAVPADQSLLCCVWTPGPLL